VEAWCVTVGGALAMMKKISLIAFGESTADGHLLKSKVKVIGAFR
jgi:hypothetical protein